jgi:hypothetical protein
MGFKKGDKIDVKGSWDFIDFYGKVEIIKTIDFSEAEKYRKNFKEFWFDDDEAMYLDYKKNSSTVYVARVLEDVEVGKEGDVIVFPEEFLNLKATRLIERK